MKTESNLTYQKANSFVAVKGAVAQKTGVFDRLKVLKEKLSDLDETDLCNLALQDLFGRNGDDPEICEVPKFELREHVIEEIDRLDDSELERYLRYRYAYEVNHQTKTISDFPPVVQIEPTSICNYRCVFCYQTDSRLSNKKHGHMGTMSLELFKSIVDQLEGRVEGITLASRGEPSLNKELPKMLDYLKDKFLATKINTNGSFLTEELCRSILRNNLQTLVFSADAASDPLYSQMRVNGNLNKVLKNVERFYEIQANEFPESRTITRVSGVKYTDQQDIDGMDAFWGKFVDQVSFVKYNPWENVYDAAKNGLIEPCSDLWRRMFIWWDGKACPCDVDYLTTLMDVNVKNSSLTEIWTGNYYKQLRNLHLSGARQNIEPCSRCFVI
jgi:MoaA/NifB/PqqE/SkfB family radical SAM enzyme